MTLTPDIRQRLAGVSTATLTTSSRSASEPRAMTRNATHGANDSSSLTNDTLVSLRRDVAYRRNRRTAGG